VKEVAGWVGMGGGHSDRCLWLVDRFWRGSWDGVSLSLSLSLSLSPFLCSHFLIKVQGHVGMFTHYTRAVSCSKNILKIGMPSLGLKLKGNLGFDSLAVHKLGAVVPVIPALGR